MPKLSFLPILGHNKTKQALLLFVANVANIPISLITSIILTRFLGSHLFGDYKFIHSIFNFCILIVSCGFFQAGNRAMVLTKNTEKANEYYGSQLVLLLAMFLVMSIGLILYAFLDFNIIAKKLTYILLSIIPFGWVFLLNRGLGLLLTSDNKISTLAKLRVYPNILFLFTLLPFYFSQISENRLLISLYCFVFSYILFFVFIFFIRKEIKVSFHNIKRRILETISYNKSYGFNVYIGAILAVGFASLTELLISYFGINNSGVGFYSLAISFATPLSVIPSTLATTFFKDFAQKENIPRKVVLVSIAASVICFLLLCIFIGPFVKYSYGDEFMPVVKLTYYTGMGVLMFGFGDFINSFLASKGRGKEIRNSAVIVGIILIILNVVFIPKFGEQGAVWTKLISGFVYLVNMYVYYRMSFKSKPSVDRNLQQ